MGKPGYYLVTLDADGEPVYDEDGLPVISGSLITLPKQCRIGMEYGYLAESIAMRTERFRNWVYPQADLEVRRMTFRLRVGAELEAFRVLHAAVNGMRNPFIWVPDVDLSPLYTLFCRKEKDFMVRQLENVAHGGMVDYMMTLTEEPTGPEITD